MELIAGIILLGIAGWVYSDADDREMESPGMWAVGVFLVCGIFLPMYLMKRPSK